MQSLVRTLTRCPLMSEGLTPRGPRFKLEERKILRRRFNLQPFAFCADLGFAEIHSRDLSTSQSRIPRWPPQVATIALLSIALSGTGACLSFRIQAPRNGIEKQRFLLVRDFVRPGFCEKTKNATGHTFSTTASERPYRVNFYPRVEGGRDSFALMYTSS